MVMNMVGVVMGSHHDLKSGKVFGKLHSDFVCGFGCDIILRREGLHDMVIGTPVLFTVSLFYIPEFFQCRIG